MSLVQTIRMMAEKKDEPPFDVSKSDYVGAAKELTQYAKTKGGMDKDDFLSFANRMSEIGKRKSPKVMAKFARDLESLDTSPREKIVTVMRNNGIKVKMGNRGLVIEEHDATEWEELDEAMVRGKEVFDKTFANQTQADNFAKKNGGRVKKVGRVFYVFKESPEDDMPASSDESSMALRQAEFIQYVGEEIEEFIEKNKPFPEWMQNKLSALHQKAKDVHSAMAGEYKDGEEDELDEKLDKDSFHTSVEKGKFMKSKYGRGEYQNAMFLHDLDSKGKPMLVTFAKQSDAENAAKKFGGKIIKSGMGTFRIIKEEVELDEAKRNPSKSGGSGYDLYHKDFSSAMKHAYDHAKKKLGIEIDPKEIDDKVASGPRKPSKGKTNTYRLMGKDGKKGVQIQVANLDDKKFELNMYKESVEMDEAKSKEQQIADLEKMLNRISGNTASVRMKKFALQRKIDKLKNEEVELDELKKYDKNKDYQLLNRLSQKAKTGKLTPSEKSQMANAKSRLRNHGFSEEVEMKEEVNLDELFESAFEEPKTDRHGNTKSFLDAIMSVVTEDNTNDKSDDGEGMDKVQPKALKKKFKDRKDKDIDNDGDVDDSDEYLHKRRKTVSKAVKKDDKDDSSDEEPKGADVGKSGKQTKVDTNPSLSEEEMTSAEKEKMEKIKAELDKKKDEFVKKYGDRAKEVIARTAIKMAKKSA